MSWNHRVLATVEYHLNNEPEICFSMHEVYYDKNGIPDRYTSEPIRISTDSMEGMKWILDRMQECLTKPVLWAGPKFPQEYEL